MGRETEHDILKRRDTSGTFDHFAHHVRRAARSTHPEVQDVKEVLSSKKLPEPLEVMVWVYEETGHREPFAEYVTPEVAKSLAKFAADGSLYGFLLVNAFMPAGEFERVRRAALKEAGVRRPPKKPSAIHRDRWLDLLFLYLTVLTDATPADLAKHFLFDGKPHEFGRDSRKAARLSQRVRDGIDAARGLLREHGVQI